MPYESGQVRVIYPYVHSDIKQFILGGPADGDEAQLFHRQFPKISITGFEPNKAFYQYQIGERFPGNLCKEALWSSVGEMPFYPIDYEDAKPLDEATRQSIRGAKIAENSRDLVPTITLDSVFFPAEERSIALWIDIERSELECLKGSQELLQSRAISVILLEAMGDTINNIRTYLELHEYQEVHFFNNHDYIFCQKEDCRE